MGVKMLSEKEFEKALSQVKCEKCGKNVDGFSVMEDVSDFSRIIGVICHGETEFRKISYHEWDNWRPNWPASITEIDSAFKVKNPSVNLLKDTG
jgi:hypothetical protein